MLETMTDKLPVRNESHGLAAWLSREMGRRWPWVVFAAALPTVAYAIACSLHWWNAPFPGFLMMPNRVIATVSTLSWPADRSALFHSRVEAVDGETVTTSAEVYQRVAHAPIGTSFRYTFGRDAHRFDAVLASRHFAPSDYLQTYGLILVVGVTYLLLGLIVGFLQPRGTQARVFTAQALVAGLYPITGVFLHHPETPWLARFNLVLECFFAATWIHLGIVFPLPRPFTGIARSVIIAAYAAGAVLAVSVLTGVFAEPPRLAALHATYSYHAASIVFFLGAIAYAHGENREPIARLRIKAVLPGLLIASSLPLFAFVNNALGGGDFPVQFALLPIPILQASLAYAIAKHDLFDIDRLVRRSFVYGALSLIVLSVYALLLLAATQLLPDFGETGRTLFTAAFVVVFAIVFDPLRRAVQTGIDRAFYRTRVAYRATIADLSSALTTLLDVDEIAAQVTRVVAQAMQLESATLVTHAPAGSASWTWDANGPLQRIKRVAHEPFDEGKGDKLSIPLHSHGQPVGVLQLGPKRSGQPFGSDDLVLLQILANQAAIALQNAQSYAALGELNRTLDAKVHKQTEELRQSNSALTRAYDDLKEAQGQLLQAEKLASLGQLVAGVAHELNNPASFVHGGLATLADYVERMLQLVHGYDAATVNHPDLQREIVRLRAHTRFDYVARETPELLRICIDGSERIRKIVDDLRLFARADGPEKELFDVGENIDRCLGLLGHRLASGIVHIDRDYREVPPIRASAAQLAQVWTNLLTNALDALEGHPAARIRLSIRPAMEDEVTGVAVCIEDNGAGVAPQHLAKVFEPFFTTKPIGQGTGLGLSIVYGAVKGHGGRIAVASAHGSGTKFTVWLPA